MRTTTSMAVLLLALCNLSAEAVVVSFGGGANQFNMSFVPIGNPGNTADTTGSPNPAGSVGYPYYMGQHEVSRDMISKANAAGSLWISMFDMTSFGGNGVNRPATGVSWNEAARFVNWLNTSQGFQAAYKFTTQPGPGGYNVNENISLWVSGDAGFNASNPFRNSLAQYFLPSIDEWYKAAYYDPNANGYWDYPTGSNSAPTSVAMGTGAGTAVYNGILTVGPADVTQAGGLSPYGVMGLGGNVWEWEETERDLVNNSPPSARGLRGGDWTSQSNILAASSRGDGNVWDELSSVGFRVASGLFEPALVCDFDDDAVCGLNDLNAMLAAGPIANGVLVTPEIRLFDLTFDGILNVHDRDAWLAAAADANELVLPYKVGDANLDGIVDGVDFILWNSNKFSPTLLWNLGDFNGDGVNDGSDFIEWNRNKFTSSNVASVPEPGVLLLLSAFVFALTLCRG